MPCQRRRAFGFRALSISSTAMRKQERLAANFWALKISLHSGGETLKPDHNVATQFVGKRKASAYRHPKNLTNDIDIFNIKSKELELSQRKPRPPQSKCTSVVTEHTQVFICHRAFKIKLLDISNKYFPRWCGAPVPISFISRGFAQENLQGWIVTLKHFRWFMGGKQM